jgi:hypothetical protein
MCWIINIEPSPRRAFLYRVYLLDGTHVDFGNHATNYYVDTGDKNERRWYFRSMSKEKRKQVASLKPSAPLYETFILNGPSKNTIKNVNFFNKEFNRWG